MARKKRAHTFGLTEKTSERLAELAAKTGLAMQTIVSFGIWSLTAEGLRKIARGGETPDGAEAVETRAESDDDEELLDLTGVE